MGLYIVRGNLSAASNHRFKVARRRETHQASLARWVYYDDRAAALSAFEQYFDEARMVRSGVCSKYKYQVRLVQIAILYG